MAKVDTAHMVKMMQPTCGGCGHYCPAEGDWGHCKAGPPGAQMLNDENSEPYLVTFWPQVDRDELACGAFKPGN